VVAGGGQGVEGFLGRRVVSREGHGPVPDVAMGFDPLHVLQRDAYAIDSGVTAEVDALELHLGRASVQESHAHPPTFRIEVSRRPRTVDRIGGLAMTVSPLACG
jgi:hypothetical protein